MGRDTGWRLTPGRSAMPPAGPSGHVVHPVDEPMVGSEVDHEAAEILGARAGVPAQDRGGGTGSREAGPLRYGDIELDREPRLEILHPGGGGWRWVSYRRVTFGNEDRSVGLPPVAAETLGQLIEARSRPGHDGWVTHDEIAQVAPGHRGDSTQLANTRIYSLRRHLGDLDDRIERGGSGEGWRLEPGPSGMPAAEPPFDGRPDEAGPLRYWEIELDREPRLEIWLRDGGGQRRDRYRRVFFRNADFSVGLPPQLAEILARLIEAWNPPGHGWVRSDEIADTEQQANDRISELRTILADIVSRDLHEHIIWIETGGSGEGWRLMPDPSAMPAAESAEPHFDGRPDQVPPFAAPVADGREGVVAPLAASPAADVGRGEPDLRPAGRFGNVFGAVVAAAPAVVSALGGWSDDQTRRLARLARSPFDDVDIRDIADVLQAYFSSYLGARGLGHEGLVNGDLGTTMQWLAEVLDRTIIVRTDTETGDVPDSSWSPSSSSNPASSAIVVSRSVSVLGGMGGERYDALIPIPADEEMRPAEPGPDVRLVDPVDDPMVGSGVDHDDAEILGARASVPGQDLGGGAGSHGAGPLRYGDIELDREPQTVPRAGGGERTVSYRVTVGNGGVSIGLPQQLAEILARLIEARNGPGHDGWVRHDNIADTEQQAAGLIGFLRRYLGDGSNHRIERGVSGEGWRLESGLSGMPAVEPHFGVPGQDLGGGAGSHGAGRLRYGDIELDREPRFEIVPRAGGGERRVSYRRVTVGNGGVPVGLPQQLAEILARLIEARNRPGHDGWVRHETIADTEQQAAGLIGFLRRYLGDGSNHRIERGVLGRGLAAGRCTDLGPGR